MVIRNKETIGERVAYLEGIVPGIQDNVASMKEDIESVRHTLEKLRCDFETRFTETDRRLTEVVVRMGLALSIVIPIAVWAMQQLLAKVF